LLPSHSPSTPPSAAQLENTTTQAPALPAPTTPTPSTAICRHAKLAPTVLHANPPLEIALPVRAGTNLLPRHVTLVKMVPSQTGHLHARTAHPVRPAIVRLVPAPLAPLGPNSKTTPALPARRVPTRALATKVVSSAWGVPNVPQQLASALSASQVTVSKELLVPYVQTVPILQVGIIPALLAFLIAYNATLHQENARAAKQDSNQMDSNVVNAQMGPFLQELQPAPPASPSASDAVLKMGPASLAIPGIRSQETLARFALNRSSARLAMETANCVHPAWPATTSPETAYPANQATASTTPFVPNAQPPNTQTLALSSVLPATRAV
jgi:hypothetical protein